ncbi:hypothetical protein SCHPADRAFT_835884, partial [Schizopora paradoxa]
ILCLGLGSPTDSLQSRFQLCFFLEVVSPDITAYDPISSQADIDLLAKFGIKTCSENQHGAYTLAVPTLAFMPHCEIRLYERFIRANWTTERLLRLLLIGNDLPMYIERRVSHSSTHSEYPCIARLAPLLTVDALPTHKDFPNALNCTAVQRVPPGALPAETDDTFWELPQLAAANDADDVVAEPEARSTNPPSPPSPTC